MKSRILSLVACGLVLSAASCNSGVGWRKREAAKPGQHLTVEARETVDLSDREFLMRKATLGTRSERLEALDVIERANDPSMFEFLMDRYKKEDDRFLKIKIMNALAVQGDVRAVPALRSTARWDESRVGVEAIAALYELGDDTYVPRLIMRMRKDEENPEMAGLAHRTLKRMTGENLPQSVRAWSNWHFANRIAPYQARSWYWPFRQPLPPTQEGSTKVAVRPRGKIPLPKENVRVRRTNLSWQDWWKDSE
jgi:hypothetical protein